MALYSDKVMEHFLQPRNLGVIEDADGVGEVGNAKCGDIMKMYLKIDDDIITDVKFETFGCASAIASSSMATELIKGQRVEDAMQLTSRVSAWRTPCSSPTKRSLKHWMACPPTKCTARYSLRKRFRRHWRIIKRNRNRRNPTSERADERKRFSQRHLHHTANIS